MVIAAKIGIVLSIFLFGVLSGWMVQSWRYDAKQLKIAEALAKAQKENEVLKDSLREKKDEELKKIADSAATLAAGRVRLPKGCIRSDTTEGSSVSTPSPGELPDAHQRALDDFKRSVDALAREADEAVANCRVVMEWAKKQNP